MVVINISRAITLGWLLVFVGCTDSIYLDDFFIHDAHYADMEAVLADTDYDPNPIIRGWIPEFLPVSAKNIQERHSLDTNEGWGKFSFSEIDLSQVEEHWSRIGGASPPKDPNRFPYVEDFQWSLAGVSHTHTFTNGTFRMIIDVEKNEG